MTRTSTSRAVAVGGAVAVLALPAAPPAAASHAVQITGTVTGTVSIAVDPEACPGGFVSTTTAQGRMSHLGKVTFTATECDVLDGTALTASGGTFTLTAANGDRITATYSGGGTVTGSGFEYAVHETVTGGTGRFRGARGTLTGSGGGAFTSQAGGELYEHIAGSLFLPHGRSRSGASTARAPASATPPGLTPG